MFSGQIQTLQTSSYAQLSSEDDLQIWSHRTTMELKVIELWFSSAEERQLTRSVKRLGVLSNSSELRRSLFNLGRLIDLVFRNHKMGEDSDSVKPTRAPGKSCYIPSHRFQWNFARLKGLPRNSKGRVVSVLVFFFPGETDHPPVFPGFTKEITLE